MFYGVATYASVESTILLVVHMSHIENLLTLHWEFCLLSIQVFFNSKWNAVVSLRIIFPDTVTCETKSWCIYLQPSERDLCLSKSKSFEEESKFNSEKSILLIPFQKWKNEQLLHLNENNVSGREFTK